MGGVIDSAVSHGSSELKRINYLDGWRGLAILFVLQSHFLLIPGINSGRLGVDVFFCLSGFLMSRILFIKRVSLAIFYKRRISRILPVFIIFVVTIYFGAYLFEGQPRLREFFSTILFFRTYYPEVPDIWRSGIPIGNLWSLNVEEHCYVMLSILAFMKILRGREGIILIVGGIMSIVIHVVYIKFPAISPPMYGIRTETAASHLLLSAGYFLVRKRLLHSVKPWMPIVSLLLGIICYTELFPWWSSILLSPFLLAFSVNHLSEAYTFVHKLLSISLLQLLGIWSYSIYLWQQPIYVFYETNKQAADYGVIMFFAAVLAGIISFYLIENPVRAWLNNNW